MTAQEWATLADLGTALGTRVLAAATFASVRSSSLMARVAQQQLLIDLRPVLTASRREDPALKVNFGDLKWVQIPGGAVGKVGFWQGAFRDTSAPGHAGARKAVEAHEPWTVELLYADHEGGQRAVSRFIVLPASHPDPDGTDGPAWLASNSRHWSIDRPGRP